MTRAEFRRTAVTVALILVATAALVAFISYLLVH